MGKPVGAILQSGLNDKLKCSYFVIDNGKHLKDFER